MLAPGASPGPEASSGPARSGGPEEVPLSRAARVLPWAVPALLVFAASLALDARTLMPGLGFWDTAEFQTIGPTLGIAHPTGYPSYTLLLWLASVVLGPFGDPAFRANLLSALLVSGAAALAAIAIVQLTRRSVLAVVGGIAFAIAPIAWRNAVRADPHAFQVFLVALLLVLLIAWSERERAGSARAGRWLIGACVAFALAVTNHGLTVALAPGVAVYVLLVAPRILWQRWRLVLACAITLAVLIVAIYAYLPIRSSMDPPLDYAHPADWVRTNAAGRVTGGFRYLVLGEQFGGKLEVPPLAQWPAVLPGRLADGARVVVTTLRDELGILMPLALLGIPLGLWRRPREVVMTGLWFVLTFTVALGYPNADITRYYLAPLLVACVWAALALDGMWAGLRSWWSAAGGPAPDVPLADRFGRAPVAVVTGALAVALLVPVVLPVPERFDKLDASHDTVARRWLDETLAAIEPNAVVVSWWSYSTPLWYGRYVEGRRPDLLIVDDRTIVDGDLGGVPAVVERYLGKRPVYVIRLDRDLGEIERRWRIEPVPGISSGGSVYRVIDPDGPS
jgi:hypothetical protein